MKYTKKIFAVLLCLVSAAFLFSCTKTGNYNKIPEGFFDDKTEHSDTGTSDTSAGNTKENNASNASGKDNGKNTDIPSTGNDSQKTNNVPENNKDNSDDKSNESGDKTVHIIDTPFSHSDTEKQVIVARYREAEGFYYDMLYQNFELDNMDTVTLESDGYETVYHRVILEDINSLSELKALYGLYFTSGFIRSVDFSAYREDGGKLYCASTTGSGVLSAKYDCSIESTDEDSAVVVRVAGSGTQRINAEKIGDGWFFDGVAMR